MTWDSIWRKAFDDQVEEVQSKTGTTPYEWRTAGRATKEYPNKEDGSWWDENGQKMFFDFINAYQESQLEIWVSPEGVPGIEIGFTQYFGDVLIKAFADFIGVLPTGELVVVDFKTGKSTPDSAMQLGIYACLMEMQFGVRPTRGYFYSARSAKFEEAEGLNRWTIPVMTELFAQFARALEAEVFLPNVGFACSTCGVKEYCYTVGGELAQVYDPLAQIK